MVKRRSNPSVKAVLSKHCDSPVAEIADVDTQDIVDESVSEDLPVEATPIHESRSGESDDSDDIEFEAEFEETETSLRFGFNITDRSSYGRQWDTFYLEVDQGEYYGEILHYTSDDPDRGPCHIIVVEFNRRTAKEDLIVIREDDAVLFKMPCYERYRGEVIIDYYDETWVDFDSVEQAKMVFDFCVKVGFKPGKYRRTLK